MNIVKVKRVVNKKNYTEEEKRAICSEVKTLVDSGKSINEAKRIVSANHKLDIATVGKWDKVFRIFSRENTIKKDWTETEKQNACVEVKDLITKGVRQENARQKVADKYKINPKTILKWNKQFETFDTIKKDWTDTEKQSICMEVKDLIQKGINTLNAETIIAKKYGLYPNTICKWDQKFRIFSYESVIKKGWTDEEKKNICREVKNLILKGTGVLNAEKIIAEKYGIVAETITSWDRMFRIFSSKVKIYTLKEKIDICNKVKIFMESSECSARQAIATVLVEYNNIDALKQYYDFSSDINTIYKFNREFGPIFSTKPSKTVSKYSDERKIEILDSINNGKSIDEVAQEHDIASSTLYTWNKKLKVFKSQRQIIDEAIKEIEQISIRENQQSNIVQIISSNNNVR